MGRRGEGSVCRGDVGRSHLQSRKGGCPPNCFNKRPMAGQKVADGVE